MLNGRISILSRLMASRDGVVVVIDFERAEIVGAEVDGFLGVRLAADAALEAVDEVERGHGRFLVRMQLCCRETKPGYQGIAAAMGHGRWCLQIERVCAAPGLISPG